MTRTVKQAVEFPRLNLSITETIFSLAGEVIETTHTSPIQINSPIRSFTFKGGKMIEFPDTDQATETYYAPGIIAPGPKFFGKTHFKVTILQDDTRDYCIQLLSNNYAFDTSITDLAAGETLEMLKGCLIYVYGTNYVLNTIICKDSELFALENNDAIIVATDACKVYMFRAIPPTII